MNFNLEKSTIFLTLSGSRAYGFHRENSDYDYRGICIPPLKNYIMDKFEQIVDKKEKNIWKNYSENMVKPDSDMQIMELTKFYNLALGNNPAVVEILFSDESDYIIKHSIFDELLQNKNLFLTREIKNRFCGYSFGELKKMKSHKEWLDNPPKDIPKRKDFGLEEKGLSNDQLGAAESLIKEEVEKFILKQEGISDSLKTEVSLNLEEMLKNIWCIINPNVYFPIGDNQKFSSAKEALEISVMKSLSFTDNFIEHIRKEKKYRQACQNYSSYQTWLVERNPERAALEAKLGYDAKNATHLIRLIRMCREVLTTGKVYVKRPDAQELLDIRNGAWSYESIVEYAQNEYLALNELVKSSILPIENVHQEKLKNIIYEMIIKFCKT